jgi:site-specific DNA recombinase
MAKYVIYARKSSESDDRQVLSIDSQVRELRSLAHHHGVEIAEVLTESRSAKAPGRPVFNELMRRIERGHVAGVLSWKMDRLARNPLDSGRVLQALADGSLERVITSDGVKTSDGNDRLMGTFELAMATKFIDDLRANVKRGNRARLEQGWPNYRPPLGYLNDQVRKTVVNDEQRFPLVRKMWDMLLAGSRPKDIADIVRDDWGFTSPQMGRLGGTLVSRSTIYRIFTDRYYAGYIDLKDGRSYLGAHEPMISIDEFERAQTLLGNRAHPQDDAHVNPLAGLIRCGNCGCSIIAEFHAKAGHTYVYYRCTRAKPGVRCREKPISEATLVAQLATFFERLAIPEPILAFLRQRLDRLDENNGATSAAVVEQRDKALKALAAEERELLSMRMRQVIDDIDFQRERSALQQRRLQLQQQAERRDDQPTEQQARAAQLRETLSLAEAAPLTASQGVSVQLRSVLVQLQLKLLLQGRRLDFTGPKPVSMLIEAGANSNWQAKWDESWEWILEGDSDSGTHDGILANRSRAA